MTTEANQVKLLSGHMRLMGIINCFQNDFRNELQIILQEMAVDMDALAKAAPPEVVADLIKEDEEDE